MQRRVNLEPGIQLTEVARTPEDVQRGQWEYLQRSWPLALSFLLSFMWPQVHVPHDSTHGGCTRYVQPEFHGGYPSQNWLFLVFCICKWFHPDHPLLPDKPSEWRGGMILCHGGSRIFPEWLFSGIFFGEGSTDGQLRISRVKLGVKWPCLLTCRGYQPGLSKTQKVAETL